VKHFRAAFSKSLLGVIVESVRRIPGSRRDPEKKKEEEETMRNHSLTMLGMLLVVLGGVVPPSSARDLTDVFSRGSTFAVPGAANLLTFSHHGRPF